MVSVLLALILAALLVMPLLYNYVDAAHIVAQDAVPRRPYQLEVKTEPPILHIEGSGRYDAHTHAVTGTAPQEWMGYKFVGWMVDGIWYYGNPIKILMDKSHTAVAIYSITNETQANGKKHLLTIISPYGETAGSGWYGKGETAKFRVLEPYVYDEMREGVRYAFVGWDDGNTPNLMSNFIVVNGSKIIKAIWTEQYRLELSSVQGMDLIGAGWHDKGSRASLVAISDSEPEPGKVKYTFKRWVNAGPNAANIQDPESPNTSLIMDRPYTIMADWKKLYYFDVNSAYGEVEGDAYHEAGTYAIASIDSEVHETGKSGVRVVFDGWDGDAKSDGMNVKVFMEGPKSIDAKWKKQYYLTINSEYGTPSGSDWYDEGQLANFNINIPRDPAGLWKQQIFYGWDGSFTGTSMTGAVLMNGSKQVTAMWHEDFTIAYFNIGIIAGTIAGGSVVYAKMKKLKKRQNQSQELPAGNSGKEA